MRTDPDDSTSARVELAPVLHLWAHSSGSSDSAISACAGVFAALGVVRRGRGQAVRRLRRPLPHALVKVADGEPAGGRIAADLVEREQAVIAIERGVLQRLRHHRPGELLHLEREAARTRAMLCRAAGGDQVERERVAQEIEDRAVGAEPVGARLGDRAASMIGAVLRARGRKPVT